jgi:hypothetical protein
MPVHPQGARMAKANALTISPAKRCIDVGFVLSLITRRTPHPVPRPLPAARCSPPGASSHKPLSESLIPTADLTPAPHVSVFLKNQRTSAVNVTFAASLHGRLEGRPQMHHDAVPAAGGGTERDHSPICPISSFSNGALSAAADGRDKLNTMPIRVSNDGTASPLRIHRRRNQSGTRKRTEPGGRVVDIRDLKSDSG